MGKSRKRDKEILFQRLSKRRMRHEFQETQAQESTCRLQDVQILESEWLSDREDLRGEVLGSPEENQQ